MHLTRKSKTGVGAVALVSAAALVMTMSSPALADVQPQSTDAVAVGSDTVQYLADFGADGVPALGANPKSAGYNSLNLSHRIFSFDATADASGRAVYNSSGAALSPTIVLRAQSDPITRPNGSGAGITALLADTTHQIDFVRSSRLPKASEEATAKTTASFGGLGIHVYQIADDELQIATSHTGTNAPADITALDLARIYASPAALTAAGLTKAVKWSDLATDPGHSGDTLSSDNILAVLPQSGSGTRNDFLADLRTKTGLTLADPGDLDLGTGATGEVVQGEEHDPTAISNSAHPTDTIEPFSTGRFNLINTGYFGTTPAPNTISLLPDTTAYHFARELYFLTREVDVTSATPFQNGGTTNLVKTLFGTATSWYARAGNSALIDAAGVTQHWLDLNETTSG
jgi:ABC-type phosphate transport system substrate-binding protein